MFPGEHHQATPGRWRDQHLHLMTQAVASLSDLASCVVWGCNQIETHLADVDVTHQVSLEAGRGPAEADRTAVLTEVTAQDDVSCVCLVWNRLAIHLLFQFASLTPLQCCYAARMWPVAILAAACVFCGY